MDELRRGFHDRLAALHDEVASLTEVAAASIEGATAALLEGDQAAAGRVIAARYTGAALLVEQEVVDLIALQGPMARDLRLLMASLRIAHEVDLSLGLAANIARRAGRLDPEVMTTTLRSLLYEMGAESAGLIRRAGQAYRALDEALAYAVLASDGRVQEHHRHFLKELFALRNASIEGAVELGIVARCYERVADHAVEIADRVRFVASLPSVGDQL